MQRIKISYLGRAGISYGLAIVSLFGYIGFTNYIMTRMSNNYPQTISIASGLPFWHPSHTTLIIQWCLLPLAMLFSLLGFIFCIRISEAEKI
jgi:hypothetical protein